MTAVAREWKLFNLVWCHLIRFTEVAPGRLREARELFASMGNKPELAETETLLGEGEVAPVWRPIVSGVSGHGFRTGA